MKWLIEYFVAGYKYIAKTIPHYINHLIIACCISYVFQEPLMGVAFYAGREIRDWEKLANFDLSGFDYPGFWVPAIPLIAFKIYLVYFR